MRTWNVTVWWRVGAVSGTVRVWTRRGAIKAAKAAAKTAKPKADIMGVTVR